MAAPRGGHPSFPRSPRNDHKSGGPEMKRSNVNRTRAVLLGALLLAAPAAGRAQDCARHYVAGGDHIPAGHEVSEDERYPSKLIEDHLHTWGPWCVYNTAANEATSSTYISGGQLAQAWNMRA